MRRALVACAATGLVSMSVCVAVASCGLATYGAGEAASDASSGSRPDARPTKDGPGGGGDVTESGPQNETGVNDVLTTPDTSTDVQGEEDAPSVTDVASEMPPPPTCTGCNPNECCDNGTCTKVGNTACGDPGLACVDCTTSALGNQCIMLNMHQTCGCGGPDMQDQCPANNACHNMQCGTSCDGQHPCNGGCCSGNDLASSTCVTACSGPMKCMGSYCQ